MNNLDPNQTESDGVEQNDNVTDIGVSSSSASIGTEQAKAAPVDLLMSIPVTLSMELGRAKLPMKEIMGLKPGSVVELDRLTSEPIDILINGKLVALGEAVTAGDKYGVRVIQVLGDDNNVKQAS